MDRSAALAGGGPGIGAGGAIESTRGGRLAGGRESRPGVETPDPWRRQ